MKRLLLTIMVMATGCSHLVKVPTVQPDQLSDDKAQQAYSRILEKYVNEIGQVDFEGLNQDRMDLDYYVAYVGNKKLEDFPDKWHKLAHYINAYNALSMHQVLEKEIPEDNDGFISRAKFFYFPKYIIGGQKMSLYSFENEVIRKMGDERIHFALNCMAVSCPRLPKQAFTGAGLDQELTAASKEFFAKPTNLRVDQQNKKIYISEIMDFFTEDFVPAKAPSLPAYVNKWTETKVPESDGFEVEFFDYDWTINNSNRLANKPIGLNGN